MIEELKQARVGNEPVKQKKYESMIQQIWEILPCFIENEKDLGGEVGKILPSLEKMIKTNQFEARIHALKSFNGLIAYCKNSNKDIESIKKARIGLMKCSVNFIKILSKLYLEEEHLGDSETAALLNTITHFCWIGKQVSIQELFVESLQQVQSQASENTRDDCHKEISILIAMLERVKLNTNIA